MPRSVTTLGDAGPCSRPAAAGTTEATWSTPLSHSTHCEMLGTRMRGELGSRATAAAVFSSSVPWILATSSRMLTWAYRCFTVESPTVRRSTGSAAVILSMRFGVPSGYVLRARRKEDTVSDELRGKRSWDSLWRSREEAAEDGMGLVSVTPG